ncbi:MAG: hypothetical protein ACI4EO_01635 [Blautia sp.]
MMKNADITIFNQIIGEDRREVFVPTMISGVCWYDVRSLSRNERNREAGSRFVIRIPYDAKIQDDRIYIPEEKYKKLTKNELKKYWTIQKNAYLIRQQIVKSGDWMWDSFSFRFGAIKELVPEEINRLRSENEDFVTVVEYADNTVRGSDRVKHWRIEGN